MATYLLQTDTRGAVADLEGMGRRAVQLGPLFDRLTDALIAGERTLWKRNGGGGRNAWPPNTKQTIARKIARGADPRTMRDSGYTERALTMRRAPGQIAHGGGTVLTFGVKGVGANVAQFSKNPRRRRQVVKMLPATRKDVRGIILDHILEGLS